MNQITNQTVQEFDDLDIWAITGGHKEGYHVVVHINGKPVQMELDTGAAFQNNSGTNYSQNQ